MDSSKLGQFTVWYNNSEEFHRLKQEIFTHDTYYFESDTPQPVIIDAGAHIGLATLYFKKTFPGARITAIEPNPSSAVLLEKNIWENQLSDVIVVTSALAADAGQKTFYIDEGNTEWFSTSGFYPGAWNGQQETKSLPMPTLPLNDFLSHPVDFLKMDIEGSELEVLTAAGSQLQQVKHLIVEFHPGEDRPLSKLLDLLKRQQFEITIWKDGKETSPTRARGLVLVEAVHT